MARPFRTLALSMLATAALQLQAQTLKDPALEALYVSDKAADLQRVSSQRVAANPDDAQAVMGLALSALMRNDAGERLIAIQHAQNCVDKQPRAAPCQYALGVVLGVQAMSEGLFKAARSAGTVRSALMAAHELEPAWYPGRSALVEFYLAAPGMMGGSTSKAGELAKAAPTPEQQAALQARVAMNDKRFEQALQALNALPSRLPAELADDVQSWTVQSALAMVNAGQAAKAQPALERLLREQPGRAGAAYALARVRGELGAHEEAVKLYEQAAVLRDAEHWPIAYRLGLAQQQLGRNDAAKASYQRFVKAGKGQKSALEDAQKRLEQLGG